MLLTMSILLIVVSVCMLSLYIIFQKGSMAGLKFMIWAIMLVSFVCALMGFLGVGYGLR